MAVRSRNGFGEQTVNNWLIVRTDFRKEAYVARQVEHMGFDAWVPVQVIACRPQIARRVSAKAHLKTIKEVCLLPRRVFVSMPLEAAAEAVHGEYGYLRQAGCALERNAALDPVSVPGSQIAAFRAEIDRENVAALALAQKASRKQKAKWRSLHDALLEMIDAAKEQLEQAA